jgi:hypothetical protein
VYIVFVLPLCSLSIDFPATMTKQYVLCNGPPLSPKIPKLTTTIKCDMSRPFWHLRY